MEWKKRIAVLLAAMMILSFVACANKDGQDGAAAEQTEDSAQDEIVGAYEKSDNPVVTEEARAALTKATETLLGVTYEPVALLATQIVSGTNYCFLCKSQVVAPDQPEKYCIVYVYEDLQGNADVTQILNADAEAGSEGLAGCWTQTESPAMTAEAEEALTKATENLLGATYSPVAYLASQVVSGTNYCILCEITAVTPSAEPHYSIVYVYEDLDGNAEVTETVDFVAE